MTTYDYKHGFTLEEITAIMEGAENLLRSLPNHDRVGHTVWARSGKKLPASRRHPRIVEVVKLKRGVSRWVVTCRAAMSHGIDAGYAVLFEPDTYRSEKIRV